jgi:putative transposase
VQSLEQVVEGAAQLVQFVAGPGRGEAMADSFSDQLHEIFGGKLHRMIFWQEARLEALQVTRMAGPPDSTPPPGPPLTNLSEDERTRALERFRLLRPYLDNEVPLLEVVAAAGVSLRTARYWVRRYRREGLAGLARKARRDKDRPKVAPDLLRLIEGLALQKPPLSAAAIQRRVATVARDRGLKPPSYSLVYAVVRKLDPSLVTLAHEGTKAYCDSFDLVHRREAEAPNAIWQADHSELDILVHDEKGEPRKPWLTIVLDDYSRAVAGYFLSFRSPSAIQTALALRQAIWRKAVPAWHVCGIPEVLYTDHGSDFTSRHIEQVAADLKIRLIFSTAGKPRGRGKLERFFETITQVLLPRLPGFSPGAAVAPGPKLTLEQLAKELETYLVRDYHLAPHSTTKEAPQARWERGGFLPQMPDSLEQLDLLLLAVPTMRKVHPDGIRFLGMRYIDPTLAAFVGEPVLLRYDPRDVAEVRVFHRDRFVCRAICQELAGQTVALREIVRARNDRRRALRQTIEERRRTVESLLDAKRWCAPEDDHDVPRPEPRDEPPKLKRYFNE